MFKGVIENINKRCNLLNFILINKIIDEPDGVIF